MRTGIIYKTAPEAAYFWSIYDTFKILQPTKKAYLKAYSE
jgi:hypothetical protein